MIGSPMLNLIEKFLNLTSDRHSLVVSNMANVDTPGYRTVDLNFHAELQRAMNSGVAAMTPVSRPVPGLLERPDGNNVNIDRESLLLAETQIQYRIGVELLRTEFHKLLTAINEGSKA
jgi:flagellar basal-body rod protein FlgB